MVLDQRIYRSMIGTLLYLTTSQSDIMLRVCLCARVQASSMESHLKVLKKIIKYVKHTTNFGLWLSKQTHFDHSAYTDLDYDLRCAKSKVLLYSTRAISINNSPMLHSRTKHMEVKYHFIREPVLDGDIDSQYVPMGQQLGYIFTKPLGEERYSKLTNDLGILPNPFERRLLPCYVTLSLVCYIIFLRSQSGRVSVELGIGLRGVSTYVRGAFES